MKYVININLSHVYILPHSFFHHVLYDIIQMAQLETRLLKMTTQGSITPVLTSTPVHVSAAHVDDDSDSVDKAGDSSNESESISSESTVVEVHTEPGDDHVIDESDGDNGGVAGRLRSASKKTTKE